MNTPERHDPKEVVAVALEARPSHGGRHETARKMILALLIETIASLLVGLAPRAALSQEPLVQPGEEVRVRWDVASPYSYAFDVSQLAVGEVVDARSGAILVRRGSRMITIPMASVRTLERRIGTKPASAPRMVKGSALGFLAGFALGTLMGASDTHVRADGGVVNSGIVSGVLVGAPAGALLAYLTSRRRGIYERIPLGPAVPAAVSWSRDGTVGVAFRVPSS